jgi:hypothetical protein
MQKKGDQSEEENNISGIFHGFSKNSFPVQQGSKYSIFGCKCFKGFAEWLVVCCSWFWKEFYTLGVCRLPWFELKASSV